jgi:X breakpoint 2-interacting protein
MDFFVDHYFYAIIVQQERMLELQGTHKASQLSCEASERELELEAQLVEARSIIQEQVSELSDISIKP